MRGSEGFVDTYLDAFLRLVDNVPPFCYSIGSDHVSGGYKYPLILQSSLLIETTRDKTYNRRWRSLDYFQCLGFPFPKVFEKHTASDSHLASSDRQSHQTYLTTITLAWSYVISCRWVEICDGVGESVQLVHRNSLDYWELVIRGLWSAEMKRGKGSEVSPDSALAFNILLDFCTKNHLERELLTGFTTVFMLTSRNIPLPKIAPPILVSHPYKPSSRNEQKFQKILDNINRYMSLSATQNALDSLLYSTFFDPRVPCNLTKPLLDMMLRDIPPLFLQIAYYPQLAIKGIVICTKKFATSFLCRDEAPVPWTPSPPFKHPKFHLQYPILGLQCTLLHNIHPGGAQTLKVCSKEQTVGEQQSLNTTSRLFN
ncbi:hypothetical protein BDV25DRAFT_129688 [Aspergillus avenaceus]|uniref:Uncharacterized protein n=1 Tax=Aspergillus avenaceus TaxID=36643 RepID=A0A5N6TW21_ASPAV|nr:hypothetical protein BDV25DRAFT_129688 [Aspergillus avenaceus]